MACLETSTPMNISSSSVKDVCTNKCQYFFKYHNSNLLIENKKTHIQLSYDRANTSPVLYNGISMQVSKVLLYSPSIHTYNGERADAEMIIEHAGDGVKMLVCIPIVSSDNSYEKSSRILRKIINKATRHATLEGENVNLNLHQYNLDDFVPSSKFYAYKGAYFTYPCNGEYQYTVFNREDAYLTIPKNTLAKLQTIITGTLKATKDNNELFVNEKGPNSGVKPGDEIYIECKPTGTDGEYLQKTKKTTSENASVEEEKYKQMLINFIRSPFFIIPMMLILFYILFIICKKIASKIGGEDSGSSSSKSSSSKSSSSKSSSSKSSSK